MAATPETRDLATLDGALASIAGRTAEVTGARRRRRAARRRLRGRDRPHRACRVGGPARGARGLAAPAELGSGRAARPGDELPAPLRRVAEQFGAAGALQLPVREGNAVVGSLELLRRRDEFDERERSLALAAADEIALARRAFGDGGTATAAGPDLLGLAGDALAAGSDETRAADQVATLAAEAHRRPRLRRLALRGAGPGAGGALRHALPTAVALDAVRRARGVPGSLAVESFEDGGAVVTLQLGEPPQGALQLLLADEPHPSDPLLDRLGTFAVRAAHALRAGERRRTLSVELERTRALLTIVGQAIAQLSLVHTLDTAIEHVSGLLGAERLAVYLSSEPGRLGAGCGARAHRPARARGRAPAGATARAGPLAAACSAIPYAASDPRLAGVTDVLEETRDRGRDRRPAAGARRPDRLACGLPVRRPRADRERGAAPARTCGPAGRRGAERAAARGDEARRRGAQGGAGVRARGLAAAAGALRDLARLLGEPLARADAGGDHADDRRDARGGRRLAAHAGRAWHRARAGRDARARGAAGRADAGDPLAATADRACAAKRLRQRPRAPARPAQRCRARPGATSR